jgi:hypothetical protein
VSDIPDVWQIRQGKDTPVILTAAHVLAAIAVWVLGCAMLGAGAGVAVWAFCIVTGVKL